MLELSTACAFGPAPVIFIPQWLSGKWVEGVFYPDFLCKRRFGKRLWWCTAGGSRYQRGRGVIIGAGLALCCVFFQLLNMRIVYPLKLYNLFMQCWQPGTCQGKTETVWSLGKIIFTICAVDPSGGILSTIFTYVYGTLIS